MHSLQLSRLLMPRGLPADAWNRRSFRALAGTLDSGCFTIAVTLILTSIMVIWRKHPGDLSKAHLSRRLVLLGGVLLQQAVRHRWPNTYYRNRHYIQLLIRVLALTSMVHFIVWCRDLTNAPPEIQLATIQAYASATTPPVPPNSPNPHVLPTPPGAIPDPLPPVTHSTAAPSPTIINNPPTASTPSPGTPLTTSHPTLTPTPTPTPPRPPFYRLPAALAFLITFSGCLHCLGPVVACPLPLLPQLAFSAINLVTIMTCASHFSITAIELSPYSKDLQGACLHVNRLISLLAFLQTGVTMRSPALDRICSRHSAATLVAFAQLFFLGVLPLYCSYRMEHMFRRHVLPAQQQQQQQQQQQNGPAAPGWLPHVGAGGPQQH